MFHRKIYVITLSALLISSSALAGEMCHGMPKLSGAMAKNPSVKAYVSANNTMHKGMDIAYTGDADIDFAAGMIPHHQGAIDMAKAELKYGDDAEMKALAQRIITWQDAEIGMMSRWLTPRQSKWRAENVDNLPSVKAYKEAMQKMHHGMMINYTGDADVDFARGMIPHHQGAVDMAWVLKEYGRDAKLRAFADDIIRGQGQEIALMQAWLDKQPAAPAKAKTKSKPKAKEVKKTNDHAHH